ncbi:MAG: hypothetical protein ABIV13_01730 [Fimbriimonadales bacterium]
MLSDEKFVEFADLVVLSWENVREPVITEHNGEKRTLGGNTVMYIVSPDGVVADAFPGVYLPGDVIGSFEAAVGVAMQPSEMRDKYHKQRASKAIFARVNLSKMRIESPILDAKGAGERYESLTDTGVTDLSHLAITRDQVRQVLRMPEGLTDEQEMAFAIKVDSENNMRVLRPIVHDFLIGLAKTPAQIRDVMFKEFLGIQIDDPNLGIN